jgi:photosystem II stability/assembly factor-like uncharacterized protein
MDERELQRAFHTAFDGARPTPGAEDRAFEMVAASSLRGGAAGRRLASAAAVALALVVIATLAIARGAVVAPGRTQPAAPPRTSAAPSPVSIEAPSTALNVPYGTIVAAPSDRVALAGWGRTGAVDLTRDGGASWTQVRVPRGLSETVLDVEWVDDSAAYIATGAGLYLFEPATESWTLLSSRGDLVRLDILDRTSGFAVTAAGDVVETRDGGLTFAARDVGLHPVTWLQWVSSTQAWAAGPGGIVATVDGGHTWVSQLSLPAAQQPSGAHLVGQVGFRDERSGFAVFTLTGAGGRAAVVVYHSSDGGAHWVAESCACGAVSVPEWLRQGARDGLPGVPAGPLVVTGPDQAALVSDGGSTGTSICTTADDGVVWACRAAPSAGGGPASLAVRGRTWWLVADAGGLGPVVATSQDAGVTWTTQRRP